MWACDVRVVDLDCRASVEIYLLLIYLFGNKVDIYYIYLNIKVQPEELKKILYLCCSKTLSPTVWNLFCLKV